MWPLEKNASPPGGHVFQPTSIIFELVQDIIRMNFLTKFHEDRTINVASREKNAPPLGGHGFEANVTIFKLIQDIIETDLLTKFHEDWTIYVASRVLTRKNAPSPGGHVFCNQPASFSISLLTKFHEDRTINVASREKNAPSLCSHVCQANVTIFKLIQNIIKTNLLTKFHEDWTINANVDVAQRTTHNAQRTTDKRRSQKLTMSTLCSETIKDLLLEMKEELLKSMVTRIEVLEGK
ncbi:hypothetical protein DPMN_115768 [Dreissena polymorpha]|uniref:Uncharacterized protein n=1 Tax=Dreissena polymorpha TaxID=45954 RepID=A0A9D4KMB5_DREPO|nr:hypothetical protein DPMN_115768 [Dreissena polymorpha]